MSKLVSFVRSLYERPSYRCLILGIGAAGKTTLLYRMVLGDVIAAIPTIGFNVESVHIGREEIYFWDIGGCDKIRPLIRHYMSPDFHVLFIVDTPLCLSDPETLKCTLEELVFHCQAGLERGMMFVGIALVKQDLQLQTPPEAAGMDGVDYLVEKIKESMEGIYRGGLGSQYDIYTNKEQGGISAVTGTGIVDGWLLGKLLGGINGTSQRKDLKDGAGSGSRVPMTSPPPRPDSKPVLDKEQLRALIEKQNAEDPEAGLTPAEFFEKMESGTLERWDHRAHLKAGFYVLLEHLWEGHGLWDAAEDFLGRLGRMLSNDAKQAEIEKREKRFRNTVHRTMTTFYLHSLHTAILAFMYHQGSSEVLPKAQQFNEFLLLNPHLMDSSLWSTYYSKNIMFSPDAKAHWRLPNLKPLPNHARPAQTTTFPSPENPAGKKSGPFSEEKDRIQRFAFATLQRVKTTGERRGKIIKESLGALQRHTMGLRAKGIDVEPYSETKAYFWIQILHAAVDSLGGGAGRRGLDITNISFESFVLLFPDLMRRQDKGKEIWRTYYAEKSWESVEARMGVVVPTLKPLPNIIIPPTESARELAVAREMEIRSLIQSGVVKKPSEIELMLQEFWTISEVKAVSQPIATHGKMLWQIFSTLWKAKFTGSASLGVASIELVDVDLSGRGDRTLGVTEKMFWIQVILRRFLQFEITPPAKKVPTDHEGIQLGDIQRFLAENRELSFEDLWKEHYSEETWHSEDAKVIFVPPDLKEMEKYI